MAIQQDNTTRELIEKSIMEFAPLITLSSETTFDVVRHIIRVFMRKHPEIFWFSHQYRFDDKTGILRFKYNFTREKADFFKGEIDKVVKDDFQIDYVKSLSETERLVYVYKWIANRTTYNEYSSFNQTIYSVLVNRNSVCTGYAKTAQYLLSLIGIESELVFGKFHSDKSEHGRHVWNIVKIKEAWYHVDFCLADKSLIFLLNSEDAPIEHDSVLWNYFGVTTETILQNRSIEFVESLPLCEHWLSEIPKVEVLKPKKQLICCKSDSGTSAKVYLDSFNKDRVIKVSRNEDLGLLQNEARVLSQLLDCPHIIKSYGMNDNGLGLEQLSPWSELLSSHYYNPTESDLRNILRQLIEGLIECKDKGISYSDIHYNNVFVTKDGTYKWGDFGIAFPLQSDGILPSQMIETDGKAKGSYWFMAPETYHRNIFTESSAIYSVAMMAYFVMNDMRPPFWTDEEHQQEALAKRLNGEEIPEPIHVSNYESFWNVIRRALVFYEKERTQTYEEFQLLLEGILIIVNSLSDDGFINDEWSVESSDNFVGHDGYSVSDFTHTDDHYFCASMDVDSSESSSISIWGDGRVHDSDSFACTCGIGGWDKVPSVKDDFVTPDFCPTHDSPINVVGQFADTMGNSWENNDTDSFACTAAIPSSTRQKDCDDLATTRIPNIRPTRNHGVGCCPPAHPAPAPCPVGNPSPNRTSKRETYEIVDSKPTEKHSIWSKLFGKKEKTEKMNACAYAPAEITPHKHFIVHIFIHRPEESSNIDKNVKDVDKTATKKANKPLDIPVKNGDRITIQLSITDGVTIDEPIQNVVWRGHYIECDFGCELINRNLYSVLGKAIIAINNVPCGDLKFTLDVVPTESAKVYAPIETHRYSKIFISYAHADYSQVRGIAEGCKINGSDYFFDRHTLQAGDIFKDKIFQYIDNADLFVLCWSKNAAVSEWVQIERKHALELIEQGNHQLAIYPLSMPPEAPLPEDMSDKYNFATL